jgi:energy-coupling factor transporter ATP-binding protein EcfA2
MRIEKFQVTGLFDLYNHKLNFSNKNSNQIGEEEASVIMLYGQNGIGKTTVLRMINGLMTLDFDIFRKTKFKDAVLTFSNRRKISVKRVLKDNTLDYLIVKYKSIETRLHPKEKGSLSEEDTLLEFKFIQKYNDDLDRFSFEFIDTERLLRKNIKDEMLEQSRIKGKIIRKNNGPNKYLVNKVKTFIRDSQINYSNYFSRTEPELFDKILINLESNIKLDSKILLKRINFLISSEKKYKIDKLGLAKEKWDRKKLIDTIEESADNQNKLTIIASYIEVLESRNLERMSLAERLLNFESLLNEFLIDKTISIDTEGFKIHSSNKDNDILNETQLSTGEYHLLYLTSLALCTKVKGTVIAIDEPEMSMHIGWQRKLVNTLVQISSKASPQMIFATHSPDIAANYSNSLFTEKYND